MEQPTLAELRQRLQACRDNRQLWRSLEELADTEAFRQLVRQEFPAYPIPSKPSASRRDFLRLMGAALVMAGLAGCRPQRPREQIVPYVVKPEEIIPGKPLFFATAMPWDGYGMGLLAENHMGRPTKLEGNPLHPASLGGTNSFMQGALLNLYDPDRAQVVSNRGQISTWQNFLDAMRGQMERLGEGGAGLHLLTGTVTSPTLAAQIAALRERYPQARWHQWEPVNRDYRRAGAQMALGRFVDTVYHFDRAQRILSFDADFLFAEPGSPRYALQFIDGRRVWVQPEMNRLYVIESSPTITGAKADHRLAVRPSQVELYARAVARALGIERAGDAALPPEHQPWIEAAVRDLEAHRGASLVLAGTYQPPVVHALVHAINEALGNAGQTVAYIEPVEAEPVIQLESLMELVEAMAAGAVNTLVILESNPVLTAPAELAFAEQMANVELSVHLSLYADETTALCDWHIPAAHFLEAWSDVRAFDGTATIIQPLITPLFDGKTSHELLAALMGQGAMADPYAIVRGHWESYYTGLAEPPAPDFETFWRTALHDGIVAGTASAALTAPAALDDLPAPAAASDGLEIAFRPDPSIWDGQFVNNSWLQELPKQLSLLTWDNAALVSPATAERLGLAAHDVVQLRHNGRQIQAAVWLMPGQADDTVTLYLGYGREGVGRVGDGLGFPTYQLRTAQALWFGSGLELANTGERYELASTQNHHFLEGRRFVRVGTLDEFAENPAFAQDQVGVEHGTGLGPTDEEAAPPSLYPEYEYTGYAWGMAIDLTACIGCNACTIACQLENNIPVVGKAGVAMGREMHWLKVDRYYAGELDDPAVYFQPRPCMHCEKAPCEPVCPVEATVHDSEGLNEMVYNRCVGTRYCSNNCPYKVRRFNFFNYTEEIPLLAMWRNPDVTVRARGVMEKCTYCIQRINQARYEAEKENRRIADGEVLTACQQACPTRAIVFGDINNLESAVTRMKEQPLNYGLLEELGTQPRTTYLAEVRNPNPEIVA
ncbi:MAG TPA: TAT-variant-translocated molybdopterin oxidoreductase [Caldilineaceae bacterium]|nr:TAT-variant-translocated molybdopterin oxidoreductase [Caldilineaceae bacterium]